MKKRSFENCLSKEKRIYESNVVHNDSASDRNYQCSESDVEPEGGASVAGSHFATLDKSVQIKSWAIRNNISRNALDDLLERMRLSGISGLSLSAKTLRDQLRDDELDDIAKTLPFDSLSAVLDVEENLKNPEYAQAMTTYCHKLKGASEDIGSVIRKIFTDEVLELFNWDGRWEKRVLANLYLVDKILRGVFVVQGTLQFEKEVKREIELSHHRLKQKKYQQKKLKAKN